VIPELGQFALVLAVCLSLCQAALPLAGSFTGRNDLMQLARPAAAGQFVFVGLAFAVLAYLFLTDDFSVEFVFLNSNSDLPSAYKFTAVWGGHEGSLLLWSLMLAGWTLAVAFASRSQPLEFSSRVLGVLGIVSSGILLFTLLTSNPFQRLLPYFPEGRDLNPLLQDPGMVVHPPMLYLGYVGMSVPFAFAVAALLAGRLDRNWARWTRPWTIGAWLFLTCGIALGSWWAYYEVGWGGWWFWDPVENASFLPWLMATALVHSLAVTERRGIFKSWTVLLAISAFTLSLLGTFLVRSGVIQSVHSFANDPARGLFILGLLLLISGGAFVLYALRAASLESEGGFHPVSRESFLLANNVLLVVATALILLGTLYPLFVDALNLPEVSIGEPYFNFVFLLPMLPLGVLLGFGMHAAWQKMSGRKLLRQLFWPLAVSIALALVLPFIFFGTNSFMTVVGLATGIWVGFSSFLMPLGRLFNAEAVRLSRAQWGMCIAHFGVGVFIIAATVTSGYSVEQDVAAREGQQWQLAGYELDFRELRRIEGQNFTADEAEIEVRRDGRYVATLRPQRRDYPVREVVMTESAIDANPFRDVLIALSDSVGDGAWAVHARYKPLIRFVWIGCVIMALGGLLAATDSRYRRPKELRAGVKPTEGAKPAVGVPAEEGGR